jgi:hypothetical protein
VVISRISVTGGRVDPKLERVLLCDAPADQAGGQFAAFEGTRTWVFGSTRRKIPGT